jgi:hypothetical protein
MQEERERLARSVWRPAEHIFAQRPARTCFLFIRTVKPAHFVIQPPDQCNRFKMNILQKTASAQSNWVKVSQTAPNSSFSPFGPRQAVKLSGKPVLLVICHENRMQPL